MATITVDLDDGQRLRFVAADLSVNAGVPVREFTDEEYAASGMTGLAVQRKVVGPGYLLIHSADAQWSDD